MFLYYQQSANYFLFLVNKLTKLPSSKAARAVAPSLSPPGQLGGENNSWYRRREVSSAEASTEQCQRVSESVSDIRAEEGRDRRWRQDLSSPATHVSPSVVKQHSELVSL